MDFGDRSGVQVRVRCESKEVAVTAQHQYTAGTHMFCVTSGKKCPWLDLCKGSRSAHPILPGPPLCPAPRQSSLAQGR